eukprot:COSAG06_NODE_1610_length_8937_cov_56.029305_4_plen_294_part_00
MHRSSAKPVKHVAWPVSRAADWTDKPAGTAEIEPCTPNISGAWRAGLFAEAVARTAMSAAVQPAPRPPAPAPPAVVREDFALPNKQETDAGAFAFVLHNVFTPEECGAMIEASEARGYEPALVNTGVGQRLDTSTRNSARNIWDDEPTAGVIHERIKAHLPERGTFGYHGAPNRWKLDSLNERLRILRYDPGDYFRPHMDGTYVREDSNERSLCTVMLYLNSGGGIDYKGGETNFVSRSNRPTVGLTPTVGDVLVFSHPVLHEGASVTKGRKYAMRTDVMYTEVGEKGGLERT